MRADIFGRVGRVAFDGMPDDAIEHIVVDLVGLAEIHLQTLHRPIAVLAAHRGGCARVHFIERDIIRQRGVRRKLRLTHETITHERAHRIHLIHGRQAEQPFNRPPVLHKIDAIVKRSRG